MEMGRITGQNDDRAGWIRLQLAGIELITQSNVEDAGNDGVYPVLGMPMGHQFHIVRDVNPDGVRAFLRGFTYNNSEAHRGRERRKRFPLNILGQRRLETGFAWLVRSNVIGHWNLASHAQRYILRCR